MLDHAIGLDAQTGFASRLRFEVCMNVHASRVEPDEERLAGFVLPVNEIKSRTEKLFVHRLHTLFGQRSRILALLLTPFAEAWLILSIVRVRRYALEYAARAKK